MFSDSESDDGEDPYQPIRNELDDIENLSLCINDGIPTLITERDVPCPSWMAGEDTHFEIIDDNRAAEKTQVDTAEDGGEMFADSNEEIVEDSSVSVVEETHNPMEENTSRLTRKRKINSRNWKKNIRKRLRNEGKAYTSARKKLIPAKQIKPNSCKVGCRYNCTGEILFHERQAIFNHYYSLDSDEKAA